MMPVLTKPLILVLFCLQQIMAVLQFSQAPSAAPAAPKVWLTKGALVSLPPLPFTE
jgi:hypothetical protein